MGIALQNIYVDTTAILPGLVPSGHGVAKSPSILGEYDLVEVVKFNITASDIVSSTAVAGFNDLINTELKSSIDAYISADTGLGIDISSNLVTYDAKVLNIRYGSSPSERYLTSALIAFEVTVQLSVSITPEDIIYASDFSGSVDGWSGTNGSLTYNQSIGGEDECLKFEANNDSGNHNLYKSGVLAGSSRSLTVAGQFYIDSTNHNGDSIEVAHSSSNEIYKDDSPTLDTWNAFSVSYTEPSNPFALLFEIYLNDGGTRTWQAAGNNDAVYLKDIIVSLN